MNNFTPRAQQTLALARKEADRLNHNHVGTEHLLLGLIKLGQGVAINVLREMSVDLETVRMELEKQARSGNTKTKLVGNIPYTPRIKKVLALAGKEAKLLNHSYVGTEHILLGLLREGEGLASRVLKNLAVDIERTRDEILKELDPNFTPPEVEQGQQVESGTRVVKTHLRPAPNLFTPRAQQTMALARKEADRLNHTGVGTEHLLLGLIKLGQGTAVNVLQKMGLDLKTIRAEVEKQVGSGSETKMVGNIPYTQQVKKALALAGKEAKLLNHSYVGTEHLLLGLLREGEGVAAHVLKSLGVDIERTRDEIQRELGPATSRSEPAQISSQADPKESGPQRKPRRLVGSAGMVFSGILLSRIAGLVRERVFAHYFGNSDAAGAIRAALRIPNFLQNMLGEGVLSASFIPVYSRLLAEGSTELAGRVAGIVASLLALTVSVVVLLGVLATPLFVDIVAPGFHGDVRLLTIHIVQILFPGIGLLVLSAWCLGILNSHRMFFVSYAAPLAWNLAMIGALLLFGGHQRQFPLATTFAWASVAGSALQFGIQLPFIFWKKSADGRPIGAEIRLALNTSLAPVREIFRNLGPVVVSRGVVQLSAFVDGMIASFLGTSAVASVGYAQTIYLLPISLFGMSVAAAELPEMSRALGTAEEIHAKLRTRLIAGQRTIAFLVVPTVAGFLLLGKYIVAALYQSGRFHHEDTLYVWYILMGSTVGLLAATWGRLYSSAFYALRDTRTPLRFAIIRVTLTAGLGLLFAFPLRPYLNTVLLHDLRLPEPNLPGIDLGLGAMGLTLSAGLAGWVEFLLLRKALQSRIGPTALPTGYPARLWACSLVACAAALATAHLVPIRRPIFALAEILAVFGLIYGFATLALQIPEARAFLRRLGG